MEKEKEEIINKIETFKTDYYSTNNKNLFFKNSQKLKVAEKISNQFDLDLLLQKTVYSINGSANIYLDYTVFKLYANEYNYEKIIIYICTLIESIIEKHGYFSFYANLDGFTVTSAERYRPCVELFVNTYYNSSAIKYKDYMHNWVLLNPPSILDIVMKLFKKIIDDELAKKIIIIPKKDSPYKIAELHSL
jgi:hypothetical protein